MQTMAVMRTTATTIGRQEVVFNALSLFLVSDLRPYDGIASGQGGCPASGENVDSLALLIFYRILSSLLPMLPERLVVRFPQYGHD
jgi:hypothetical protein